jgi:hypothetical protein
MEDTDKDPGTRRATPLVTAVIGGGLVVVAYSCGS